MLRCVAGYRAEVGDLASMPLLARSYQRLDVDRLRQSTTGSSLRAEITRAAAQARRRTSDRVLPKLTSQRDGKRRIVEDPPLVIRVSDAHREELALGLDDYLGTLAPHWRRALGGYTLIDIAHKVVGVGSVGLRAYVALLQGSRMPMTSCSCSSNRPADRSWPGTCTASRPGMPTRASGSWNTSRPCSIGQRPAAGLNHHRTVSVLRPPGSGT